MAGLIAAHGRNATDGALGIAPAAKILPIKDQEPGNIGGSSAVAAGIVWAASHGASVINVSTASAPTAELIQAVSTASQKDAVIVAASGTSPKDILPTYPAAIPGVLAVGASDRKGRHAKFSMPGVNVQICAPGVDIATTGKSNDYRVVSGTSPATAIVSGAAALVRAKFPQLSAPEVIHRLTATATDIGKPGRDDECGYGVLNIVKALTADVPPLTSSAQRSTGPSGSAVTSIAPTPRSEPRPREQNRSGPLIAAAAAILAAAIAAGALTLRSRRHKQ